jgi:quinol monooxygenase YgiN
MSLRVVARIQAKPEQVAEVRELLLALIGPTRQEKGCVTYELLQNREDPCDFTFVEEWACDEDLDAHAVSDHLRDIGAQLAPLVVTPPDIRRYDLLA